MSDIFKLFDGTLGAGGAPVITHDRSSFSSVSSENDLVGTLASGSDSIELLVDYSDFSNFVSFNSAESYVTITADQILNSYPIGGSINDLQLFLDSLDGYQKYFLSNWPSRTGYLRFNPSISSSYVRVDDFGVQDGVSRSSFLSPGTGSISLQGWIDVPVLTGSNDAQVVIQKQSSLTGDGLTVFVSGSSVCFQVISGSSTTTVTGALAGPSFFAAVLDRGSVTGSVSLYVGTSGTYPTLAASSTAVIGKRFDLASGSFFFGSGSLAGKTIRAFTGSIDSVSVWSAARSLNDLSGTYNRKTYAQSGLIGLWRFSDAIPATSTAYASVVRDTSGHRLDGRIQAFFPAILASGSYDLDSPDPILSLEDSTVVNYVVQAQQSGTLHDRNNGSLIFNLFPEAFSGGDSDVFRNFALILARHFDRVKLYASQLANLRRVSYDDFDQAPGDILDEVGRFFGWDLQGNFATTDAMRYFVGRSVRPGPAGNANLDTKLSEIKAAFWKRMLLNLVYLYKTKGSRESVESLLRIYGVDAGFVRLKEYARRSEVRLPVQRVVAERSVYGLVFGINSRATSVSSDSPAIVIAGSASITLGSLTLSATGNVPVSGTSAVTLGSLVLSATGNVPVSGTSAVTLGSLTLSATGFPGAIGTLSSGTLGLLVVSATGNLPISGTLAGNSGTFGSLVLSATGNLPITGSSGVTLGLLVVASTGTIPISGTLAGNSGTLGLLVLNSSGTIVSPAPNLGSVSPTTGSLIS